MIFNNAVSLELYFSLSIFSAYKTHNNCNNQGEKFPEYGYFVLAIKALNVRKFERKGKQPKKKLPHVFLTSSHE